MLPLMPFLPKLTHKHFPDLLQTTGSAEYLDYRQLKFYYFQLFIFDDQRAVLQLTI